MGDRMTLSSYLTFTLPSPTFPHGRAGCWSWEKNKLTERGHTHSTLLLICLHDDQLKHNKFGVSKFFEEKGERGVKR